MPTITLTPTACTESAGWKTLYYYLTNNSSYYPRRINFTYPVSETLAGAGVNITKVTLHGYARNSNSAVKRLRWGFKPAADSGPGTWSALDGSSVLSGTFEAVAASAGGSYVYNRFSRSYPGDSVLARHIKAMFDAGGPVYLGVIQPDNSKSVSLDVSLANWTIDVEYELLGNVPTTSAHTAVLGATAITTTVTKVIEGSTTTLRYRLGDAVVSTAELGTGTTHTYTPPASLGAHFPSEMTGTLTIDAETSLGGVSYGTVSASVALTLPEDAAPGGSVTVTRVWAEGVPSAARLDAFVQTQSGAQFAIAGTGKYGASIAAISLTVEGKTYSGAAVTHASLAGSGDVGYAYTVTDSRGLSSSFTGVIPVLAWSPPKIQSFLILRVTEDGTEAIDGTYAKGSVTASVSSLIVGGAEKNTLSFRIRYREIAEDGSAENDWTDCDSVTGSALSGTFAGLLMQGGAYVGGGGVDGS